MVKNAPAKAGDTGLILEWGKSLEEEMAVCSSILAWEILTAREPGSVQDTVHGAAKNQTRLKRLGVHKHKVKITTVKTVIRT